MKLKVSTEILKELVTRAAKGMGNEKNIPVTSLMALRFENNKLTLITTDATNFLYVSAAVNSADDFNVVVNGEQFSKLISKMTCEKVELEITTNFLQVKGNGVYQLELPLDVDGEFVKYPDPMAEIILDENDRNEVNLSAIKTILDSCKSSLAITMENPCYTGYYAGDKVVTTNNYTMSALDANLFGKDVLVSPDYMNLLGLMTEEKFSAYILDNKIICTSPDCVVYGTWMVDDIGDFPIDGIKDYVAQDLENKCTINKSELRSVLDRIALFVSPYDDSAIRLTFSDGGLNVESKQSNGIETIAYTSDTEAKPFTGMMDIKEFTNLIKSYPDGDVKFQYGDEKALKLTAGNLAFVIAWIVDEESEEK